MFTVSLLLLFLVSLLGTFTCAQDDSNANSSPVRGPGEGLWHPQQIGLPGEVSHAILGVVRIHDRDTRFRLTLYETADAASAARKAPQAGDKEFKTDGEIVWPLFLSRPGLKDTCSITSAALSPGLFELCQALKTATCTAYPCRVMTEPVASYASGVVVGRLADGMDVILTAYHVARESIERHQRTNGQYTLDPLQIRELEVEYSSDPLQTVGTYHSISDVYLLANASERDWHDGKDWALLGVPSSEAAGLAPVPIASKRPEEGDSIWILGFPFRTQRITAPTLGYDNAKSDFRVGYGLAVGSEDLGTNPPYVITNADIVSGDSGGPLINSHGEVVGIVHNSLCKPDGEIDLGVEKFCGLTLGTSVDAVDHKLIEPHSK
jgi:Trypsin-like peptidase domain